MSGWADQFAPDPSAPHINTLPQEQPMPQRLPQSIIADAKPGTPIIAPTLTITANASGVSITKSGRNFLGVGLSVPTEQPLEVANALARAFTKVCPDWCIIINDLTQDEAPGFAAVQELRR